MYQFVALCFGPSQAPRVFTKIVTVIAAHLRIQNVRLATYLDDWLLVNMQKYSLVLDREKTLNLLTRLGFIVNLEKSSLIPAQSITYIGALFNFKKEIVSPTPERMTKLEMSIQNLMTGHNTARDYLVLLGLIASCIEMIPNAGLFMRPIQLHLLHYWKPSSKDLLCQIPFTLHLKSHLIWWLDRANTAKGRSLHQWSANITITTDASKTGFGGHMKGQIFQGKWTETQQSLHINILELDEVHRTVQHFLPQLQGQNVLIKSDNMTVVQYVNKQGGTRSIDLCYKTWDLWKMAIKNKIVLRAAHIAGRKNILADQLSRNKIFPTEWTLNDQVVQTIFSIWGNPMIDLFALGDNHKAPVSVQVNSMAAINRNFRDKGFSRDTRKLLRASWRSGTKQDYTSKFKTFNCWCSERKKDPYTANLADCADFLTSLYTSGLQYHTIVGYRSMLSSLLSPIDNKPIGQHPYIIRLLKGVFNSRPPKVKLVPEWDLHKILDMLQKSPFEPLREAEIKFVTYKIIFLTAITTFRRCSDLQVLRIGGGFVNVQSRVKPFKPVSSQTIARWIVNTIKMAYGEDDFKVNAHSTRAIGPSWALFNGASMKSILESADWSIWIQLFTKFYFRNVDVKV
ncbi:unnamed protein product [Mytilus coruscus]|uniref:Reverse transcriptase domain-containing protein n=1 Tax=Mytilus coruscus TaxID=42192 RepID=A0A6J8B004_MYTCO|nr:unnamed protein product [Mytilus coruscus]